MYLVAILDWFSRYVVSWALSDTLELPFVLDAVGQALRSATPQIWNTDQGSQFTSLQLTSQLAEKGVRISMDGKGRAYDNIFTERLWRSLKYEEIYLADYDSPRQARQGIASDFRVLQHRAATSGARLPPWSRSLSWVGLVDGANRFFGAGGAQRPRPGTLCPARALCASVKRFVGVSGGTHTENWFKSCA